jgi:hypothetical protein
MTPDGYAARIRPPIAPCGYFDVAMMKVRLPIGGNVT